MSWHPVTAPLASALVHEGSRVSLDEGALLRARGAALAAPPDERRAVVESLVIFARQLWLARGTLDVTAAVHALAGLASTILGSADAARDAFWGAGAADLLLLLGGAGGPLRAPREAARPATAAPVKAARGLRR